MSKEFSRPSTPHACRVRLLRCAGVGFVVVAATMRSRVSPPRSNLHDDFIHHLTPLFPPSPLAYFGRHEGAVLTFLVCAPSSNSSPSSFTLSKTRLPFFALISVPLLLQQSSCSPLTVCDLDRNKERTLHLTVLVLSAIRLAHLCASRAASSSSGIHNSPPAPKPQMAQMAPPLLRCSICPRLPKFSDQSHLLTHVGSKGHLAHLHKLQVRSHQEVDAAQQVADYSLWYQFHNLGSLLSARMQQKEAKTAMKRGRAVTKMEDNKEDNEHTMYPDPSTLHISPSRRPEPVTRRVTRSSLKREVTSSDSVGTDLESSDYEDTPTKKNK